VAGSTEVDEEGLVTSANDDANAPSAALTPLARAGLDQLLAELLERVDEVIETQDRLTVLLDAVVGIAADLSLDSVLHRIVRTAGRLAGAQYTALGVLGPGPERRLRAFVTEGLSDEERERIGDLPRGHGLLGLIIDEPEPVRIADINEHPASYGFPPNHPPMRSFLGVPIRIRDQVFGNLYLTEKRGGEDFTEQDQEIVVALAAAAGVVIENARLYEEAARRERWLGAVAEITAVLLGPVSREEALQLVAERAREAASADLATVVLRGGQDDLVIQAASGDRSHELVDSRLTLTGSLAGHVVSTGETLVVDDVGSDPRLAESAAVREVLGRLGPAMVLPMRTATGVEGALTMAWATVNSGRFHEIDVHMPEQFAEQAALALQVANAQEDQSLLAVFEDRDRIGRDLHDLVIQRLFAIGLSLENTSRLAPRPEVASRIIAAVDDIDSTIKDIRRSIFALSTPADATDLRRDIREVVDRAAPSLGFKPTIRTEGPVNAGVPSGVAPHLLAVLGEALSNAARHAAASAVDVELTAGDDIVLTVSDDGKGTSEPTHRGGLRNMRERAEELGGTFTMDSSPGRGSRIVWRVPSRPAEDKA
jgi:signal transduction histidine kinase